MQNPKWEDRQREKCRINKSKSQNPKTKSKDGPLVPFSDEKIVSMPAQNWRLRAKKTDTYLIQSTMADLHVGNSTAHKLKATDRHRSLPAQSWVGRTGQNLTFQCCVYGVNVG